MNSYNKFIEKYKNQNIPVGIYSEKHHIIPKHMGGNNSSENIIILTYRQHILAHLLLYRVYRKFEDLIAYKLMRKLEPSIKIALSKLIGQRHKDSGHIYKLGRKNVESGFFASIRTSETCSKGGKISGKIARETGQILSIRTEEGSIKGGEIAGKLAKDRGQIQKLGKYKGKYVLINPEGIEFQHLFLLVQHENIDRKKLQDWCKNNRNGYSRRLKTQEELDQRWTDID